LALIPPVLIPIIKMAGRKPPRPVPLLSDTGSEVRRRIKKPTMYTAAKLNNSFILFEILVGHDRTADGSN